MIGEEPYTLGLFDTTGQEGYDRLRPLSYLQMDVFLVCFSVVSPSSYENVKEKWVPEITHHCQKAPFLLIGTQVDLTDDVTVIEKLAKNKQKPINLEQGEKLAKELRAVKYMNDDDNYDNDYADDEDDEYFDSDDTDEIRDEEATEAATSSLTDYKWEHFGSRDRVEKSRNMEMQQLRNAVENPAQAAVNHFLKVKAAGKCEVPIPKVLSVHSQHPSHGKTYVPHCTILHRCSEDSGCCEEQGKKCGPKSQTIVELYFYAYAERTARVEKLSFYNHTQCACINVSELATLNTNAADIINTVAKKTISLKSGLSVENLIRCKCPSQFTPNPRYTSYCSCTCSNNNLDCERMQRGMEYLSLKDRACIKSGECSSPMCEYGKYLKDVGRCPKKQEKHDTYSK